MGITWSRRIPYILDSGQTTAESVFVCGCLESLKMNNYNDKQALKNEWSMMRKICSLLEIKCSLASSKSLVHDKLESEGRNTPPVDLRHLGTNQLAKASPCKVELSQHSTSPTALYPE